MITAVDHDDFKERYNKLSSKFGYTIGLCEEDDFIMVQYPNEELLRLHVSKIKPATTINTNFKN